MSRPFKELYCERRQCAERDYVERALNECLYWRARVLRRLLVAFSPEFFARDRRFIESFGKTRGQRDAVAEVKTFDDVNRGPGGGVRKFFRLRVSGRKALRLAREMAEARTSRGEAATIGEKEPDGENMP